MEGGGTNHPLYLCPLSCLSESVFQWERPLIRLELGYYGGEKVENNYSFLHESKWLIKP